MSGCERVRAIAASLFADRAAWTVFEANAVDEREGTKTIFLRVYPPLSPYVYDLILPASLPASVEHDIARFIEANSLR